MTSHRHDGVLYTGPFHAALRSAIRRRGLPLERLRAHLARRGVTVGLERNLELVSLHHKVVVDGAGRIAVSWSHAAVRALRDGVDRYVARYYGGPNGDPALVRALPLGNCRLGRFVTHPSAPAAVYELLFDQTLRAGDTWVFETQLVDPTTAGCTEFAYGIRYPTDQYALEVRFHPDAVPARCSAPSCWRPPPPLRAPARRLRPRWIRCRS